MKNNQNTALRFFVLTDTHLHIFISGYYPAKKSNLHGYNFTAKCKSKLT